MAVVRRTWISSVTCLGTIAVVGCARATIRNESGVPLCDVVATVTREPESIPRLEVGEERSWWTDQIDETGGSLCARRCDRAAPTCAHVFVTLSEFETSTFVIRSGNDRGPERGVLSRELVLPAE